MKASDLLEKAGGLDFDAVACADVPGMKGHLLQAARFFFFSFFPVNRRSIFAFLVLRIQSLKNKSKTLMAREGK